MTKKKKLDNRMKFYIIAVALPVLQFLVFYFYVNFNSIMLSFKSLDYKTGKWEFVEFDNFRKVITDLQTLPYMKFAVSNTIEVFLITLLTMFIPLIMSYYLFKKYPLHKVFKVFLFLPQIISSIALVLCYKFFVEVAIPEIWKMIFDEKIQGLLSNQQLQWKVLLFYSIWFGMGSQFLLYTGAMSGISDSIIEAGELDGVNSIQEFLYIVFPMIFPTFKTFVITSFAVIFTNQLGLFSFYGSSAEYSVWTMGYLLYNKTLSASMSDYPYLSSLGILLTMIAIPLCFGIRWFLTKIGPKTI